MMISSMKELVERPLHDVMKHAITLEESERRLTEMIRNYYHPAYAGTLEAIDDIKNGRVYHASSTEDLFKQILG